MVAQRNGVFGDIECTGLTVVDEAGKDAIFLAAGELGNSIVIYDKDKKKGKPAIMLNAFERENNLFVARQSGKGAVKLMGTEDRSAMFITGGGSGKATVSLQTTETQNQVSISDHYGNIRILLASGKWVDGVAVYDKAGNVEGRIP